ncbi:MAG: hypothetical protein PVI26_13865, partial [Chitinispirillia bacterium]
FMISQILERFSGFQVYSRYLWLKLNPISKEMLYKPSIKKIIVPIMQLLQIPLDFQAEIYYWLCAFIII